MLHPSQAVSAESGEQHPGDLAARLPQRQHVDAALNARALVVRLHEGLDLVGRAVLVVDDEGPAVGTRVNPVDTSRERELVLQQQLDVLLRLLGLAPVASASGMNRCRFRSSSRRTASVR